MSAPTPAEQIYALLTMKDNAIRKALWMLPDDSSIRGQLETALVSPGTDLLNWLEGRSQPQPGGQSRGT